MSDTNLKVGDIVKVVDGPYSGTIIPIRGFYSEPGMLDLASKPKDISLIMFSRMVELVDSNTELIWCYKPLKVFEKPKGEWRLAHEDEDADSYVLRMAKRALEKYLAPSGVTPEQEGVVVSIKIERVSK